MIIQVLEEFVYKCLEKAMSKGHKTIAFPALGAGNLKFPLNVAAACMVAGIVKFSKKYSIAEVRIVLYGGSPDLRQLEKVFSISSHFTLYFYILCLVCCVYALEKKSYDFLLKFFVY